MTERLTVGFFRARLGAATRRALAAACALCVALHVWPGGTVSAQKFETVYVRSGGGGCWPVVAPADSLRAATPGAGTTAFSDTLTMRALALDTRTVTDLFGNRFDREFFAYRLCLSNGAQDSPLIGASRSAVYFVRDYLRIPVTLRAQDGRQLTPGEVARLAGEAGFRSLGFSVLAAPAEPQERCRGANAFYTPPSSDYPVGRRVRGRFRLPRFPFTGGDRAKGFQQNNQCTFLFRMLEKVSSNESVERVLAVPREEVLGGRRVRLSPCFEYLQAGVITGP